MAPRWQFRMDEAFAFPAFTLRLKDKTHILDTLIAGDDEFARFRQYIVVFSVTGSLEPEVPRRSGLEDTVIREFPIVCGDVLYLKRVDEETP